MADEDLDRLAAEELLREAGRGKERASTMGTYGWKKRQVSTNKVFLKNTLRGVISGNRHQSSSRVEKHRKDRSKRTVSNVDSEDESEGHKLSCRQHRHRLEITFQDGQKYGQSSRSDTRTLAVDESLDHESQDSRSSSRRVRTFQDGPKCEQSSRSDPSALPLNEPQDQRNSRSSNSRVRTFQESPKYGQSSRSDTTEIPSDKSRNRKNSRSFSRV